MLAEILPSFPAAFRARFHSHSRRARHRRRHRRGGHAGRGRTAAARWPRADRGRRDPLDHAGRAGALAGQEPDCRSTQRGFLRVDDTLRVVGQDEVFAAGDTIAFPGRDLPKSGVYAVRAGPVLADNIRRSLTGRPLRPFRPQREALYLVSTGERYAVGTRNGLVVRGRLGLALEGLDRSPLHAQVQRAAGDGRHRPRRSRRWPISRRSQEISAIAMRCGGCGAKVGATRALARARRGSSRPPRATSSSASTRRTTRRSSIPAANGSRCRPSTISAPSSTTLTCSARSRRTIRSATSMPWAASRRRRWRSPPCPTGSKPRSRPTCPR